MFCLAPAYTGPAAPRSGDKVLKIMEKLGHFMTCNLLPSSASLSVGFVQGWTWLHINVSNCIDLNVLRWSAMLNITLPVAVQIRLTNFIHTPLTLSTIIIIIIPILLLLLLLLFTLLLLMIKVFQSGSNGSGFPFDPLPLLIAAALTFNFHHFLWYNIIYFSKCFQRIIITTMVIGWQASVTVQCPELTMRLD